MTNLSIYFSLLLCLTKGQEYQEKRFERWTDALVEIQLSESIAQKFASLERNSSVTLFNIIMGRAIENVQNMRYYIDHEDSITTKVSLTIKNVTNKDSGLYSVKAKTDNKILGRLMVLVVDVLDVVTNGYVSGDRHNISRGQDSRNYSGAPLGPFNFNITDINNEGFTISFTPGNHSGYSQTFSVVCCPQGNQHKKRTTTSTSNIIHVRYLLSSTEYNCTLYAENTFEKSFNAVTEPFIIRTKAGIGTGSHKLIYILYGTGSVCILVIVLSCLAVIIHHCCSKRKTFEESNNMPLPDVHPRATLNTEPAVYTNRAVYRRTHGLPDTATVDRIGSMSKKPKARRAIKVPPILAVFRKSRGLPDNNVISDVQEVISRSNSNTLNRNANGGVARAREEPEQIRQHASTLPIYLNYPNIDIRNSSSPTSSIQRPRQRTNYSQIDFDGQMQQPEGCNTNTDCDVVSSSYGQIFFEADKLPPRANK